MLGNFLIETYGPNYSIKTYVPISETLDHAVHCFQSKSNIISPRNGEPLIAAIQDFITGSYLYIDSQLGPVSVCSSLFFLTGIDML